MPILRAVVAAFGILLLAGAAAAAVLRAPIPLAIWLAVVGAVIIVGVLCERIVYKKVANAAPPVGWVPTGERFVDPATGRLVEVHFRAATGERLYVDAGAAPPHERP